MTRPRPSLPDWAPRFLKQAAGQTPHGDPKLRIVWSEDRRTHDDGPKKYPLINDRWVVEQWMPASVYGAPEFWNPLAGPYPSRGDYEHLDTIEERGVCECGDKLEPKLTPGIRRLDFDPCWKCSSITRFMEPQRAYVEYLVDIYKNAVQYIKEQVDHANEEMMAREARVARNLAELNEATPVWGRPSIGLPGIPLPFASRKEIIQ